MSGPSGINRSAALPASTRSSSTGTAQFAGGSFLDRVAGDSANDVWAVGQGNGEGLVEHWNGQAWSIVPSPSLAGNPNNAGTGKLDALTLLSPTNVLGGGEPTGTSPN